MSCAHTFCNACWKEHMRIGISEGMSKRLKCMHPSCGVVCDEDTVRCTLRSLGSGGRRGGLLGRVGRLPIRAPVCLGSRLLLGRRTAGQGRAGQGQQPISVRSPPPGEAATAEQQGAAGKV